MIQKDMSVKEYRDNLVRAPFRGTTKARRL
jgi:hypothetical protein